MTQPGESVALSGKRHYFGFAIRGLLDVLQRTTKCDSRGCQNHALAQLDYAYVRERDKQPTYCTDMACAEHACVFADEWGLDFDVA